MNLGHLQFKALRKLKLLNYVNVWKNITYENNKINIPLINGLGYSNLFLKPNWLYLLVDKLFSKNGEAFLDVGANIGQTLIAVKAVKKKIRYIGFEPSISCCYYLNNLIRRNNFPDCHVYNFALSDKFQETFLETNGEADPTGSMIKNLRPSFFTQRESVLSLDYDSLSLGLKVNCIKIDVEGGELEVLRGMQSLISQNNPYIICEILDSFSDDVLAFTQERADRVGEILVNQGYSIIQIVQSAETDRIVSFNEIDDIKIKQWTNDSIKYNDYIFFPTTKRNIVMKILTKLCH